MNAARKLGGHPSHTGKSKELCLAVGQRIVSAMDNNPNVPPANYGRLAWVVEQLEKRDIRVTRASVSRWLLGEVMPMPDRIEAMAEILAVDSAWLLNGSNVAMSPRDRRAHNALATGAVNLIAGMIQMGGGMVAFPEEGEDAGVDIHAIIRGARYAFHVSAGRQVDDAIVFTAPKADGLVVLGLVQREGFHFDVYEITPDVIQAHGTFARGVVEVTIKDESVLRQITSFADRI